MHDSAAILIEDGEIKYAIEEERLNRIKHTNKMPANAIRTCLEEHGVRHEDLDLIVYSNHIEYLNILLKKKYLFDASATHLIDPTAFLQQIYEHALGDKVDAGKFCFVHHHLAHAMSTFAFSGFETGLITTFDGQGDGCSGMILLGIGNKVRRMADFPVSKSLGAFYQEIIAYLGYRIFDEYKVMGLAPYGDPRRFEEKFRSFYTLLPEGNYEIHTNKFISLYDVCKPRRRGEQFSQEHKDIAAALQNSLEDIVLHILRHYREKTRLKNLCLAGGVAHNCTLNGKILQSGMFENVFVQPAAHDAGAALGAALYAYYEKRPTAKRPSQMKHVYFGKDLSDDNHILNTLSQWRRFIALNKMNNIAEHTAALLSRGYVIGWVQGRSEFGPRALGNRSILADPRPAENKDRINQIVKKREGYRPFAPSVLEEEVEQYFEVQPQNEQHNFMVFVVNVREDKRKMLGAITHIDGTARIQTVSKEENPKFWRLIQAFKQWTGIPILLNTSFNNHAEPIVESVEDALACYLTTGLDYLVIGDYFIERKNVPILEYLSLQVSLPPYCTLHSVKKSDHEGRPAESYYLGVSYNRKFQLQISPEVYHVLSCIGEHRTIKEIVDEARWTEPEKIEFIIRELIELWSDRLLIFKP